MTNGKCSKCGSDDIVCLNPTRPYKFYECRSCGHDWEEME